MHILFHIRSGKLNFRTVFLLGLLLGLSACTQDTENNREAAPTLEITGLNQSHHQDYLRSLELLRNSKANLMRAMHNVYSEEVAHYDYIQHEHIEVVRNIKALSHPPLALQDSDRTVLIEQAQELLESANELEWVISDFLEAQALTTVAKQNFFDLLQNKLTEKSHQPSSEQVMLIFLLMSDMRQFKSSGSLLKYVSANTKIWEQMDSETLTVWINNYYQYRAEAKKAYATLVASPLDHKIWAIESVYLRLTSGVSKPR